MTGCIALGFDIGEPSDGAFYAYAGISRFSNDSMSFCEAMLDEAGVAVTPGIDFDRAGGQPLCAVFLCRQARDDRTGAGPDGRLL